MNQREREQLRQRLVVALDVDTREEAVDLVETLGDRVKKYKIGSRMFTRYGPAILDAVSEMGADLFLDLKYHDIPSTVAGAVEAAAEREDVFMLTVHASGGREMVRRAMDAAGWNGPEIVAVTALTSLDERDVRDVAGSAELEAWAQTLASLALEAGADGLVCSAREAPAFRANHGETPLLVTPGIRPKATALDDQKRAVTPAKAIEAGADLLVVGRPIYQADDPGAVVDGIGRQIGKQVFGGEE